MLWVYHTGKISVTEDQWALASLLEFKQAVVRIAAA